MRFVISGVCAAISLASLGAATLSRLSLDDMINQSTVIAHVKVTGSYAAFRGPVIYTYYQAQVMEQWKGANQATVEIALPGGTANGYQQSFPGTPQLIAGTEYVLFLWTSKTGLTQIIGLTQGLFNLAADTSGVITALRPVTTNSLLDPKTGQMVKDQAIQMQLSDLTSHIASTLGKPASK
jgi:hypothetical protein